MRPPHPLAHPCRKMSVLTELGVVVTGRIPIEIKAGDHNRVRTARGWGCCPHMRPHARASAACPRAGWRETPQGHAQAAPRPGAAAPRTRPHARCIMATPTHTRARRTRARIRARAGVPGGQGAAHGAHDRQALLQRVCQLDGRRRAHARGGGAPAATRVTPAQRRRTRQRQAERAAAVAGVEGAAVCSRVLRQVCQIACSR